MDKIGNKEYENWKLLILSDVDNDGLLWRLLLRNKYKNEDEINEKLAIYRHWFEMNICKWIYHFGANVQADEEREENVTNEDGLTPFGIQPVDLEKYFGS